MKSFESEFPAQHPAAGSATDALTLLTEEHDGVRQLFVDHAALVQAQANAERKRTVVALLCRRLAVHARLEEEIFYPAARDALDDPAITRHGLAGHERMKELVEELWNTCAADRRHDVLVDALRSAAEKHFDAEEAELFPRTLGSSMNLEEVAGHMRARREQYLAGREGRAKVPARAPALTCADHD